MGRAVAQAAREAATTLQPISARRRVMPGKGYLGPMKQALATRACNSR
jgi:hypothetical protein